MRLVVESGNFIQTWIAKRAGWATCVCMTAIGVEHGGTLVAGAMFNEHSGPNIAVHIAVINPYAFRVLLKGIYRYAYNQLHCSRLTIIIESTNMRMRSIAKRLGAVHEGTLAGASRTGDDILLFRLTKDAEFWRRLHEAR